MISLDRFIDQKQTIKTLSTSRSTLKNLKTILSLQAVMGLSIGLLLFVGIGESYRVSPMLLLTNICNQAELLKSSIDANLKLGVPIEFQGFGLQAQKLAEQSEQIYRVDIDSNVRNRNTAVGAANAASAATQNLSCSMGDKALLRALTIDWKGLAFESNKPGQHRQYQIKLILDDKIGPVGQLIVNPTPGIFNQVINDQFRPVVIFSLLLIVFVPIGIALAQHFVSLHPVRLQKTLYHLTFVVVGFFIIINLIQLYASGIKGQSFSLANSLEARLNTPFKLGFDIDRDLSGIDTLFQDYRLKNQDISHIYLFHDGHVSAASVTEQYADQECSGVSGDRQGRSGDSESEAHSNKSGIDCSISSLAYEANNEDFIVTRLPLANDSYQIVVKTPWEKVYDRLWDATRNILVLFIASILLSNMLLDVLLTVQGNVLKRKPTVDSKVSPKEKSKDKPQEKPQKNPNDKPIETEISIQSEGLSQSLKLIRPVFALGVLMEAVNLSFLPAYLTRLFEGSGYSASTVFGLYFMCFAASLFPAGRWAEKHSLRNMMLAALTLSVGGLVGLAFTDNPLIILLLRAFAGFGQGVLFIAVQSYLLQLESKDRSIRGTEQLVIGFNMSTISGAAIGALLMPMLGEQGVFMTGTLIGLSCFLYCAFVVKDLDIAPSTTKLEPLDASETSEKRGVKGFSIQHLLTDIEFYKSIILIGFPTKALYVGVLIFTMPVLLKEADFDTDVIGQIIVLYYLGVLGSTHLISKFKSRLQQTEWILFLGCIGSGAGLVLIGQQNWFLGLDVVSQLTDQAQNIVFIMVILIGVLTIGISHGFIHAPIISHVVKSKKATLVGKATTGAAYRFLERLGHVSGPALAAILLFNSDNTVRVESLTTVGIGVLLLGVLFVGLNGVSWLYELFRYKKMIRIGEKDA